MLNKSKDDLAEYKYLDNKVFRKDYKQVRQEFDILTTYRMMVDFHHKLNTKKNESLNQSMTIFVSKNSHFSGTIVWQRRIYVTFKIDSLGYFE